MNKCVVLAGIAIAAAVAMLGNAQAAVDSPRVLSPHHAAVYSMKTFAQFVRWRHLTGDQKAFENQFTNT